MGANIGLLIAMIALGRFGDVQAAAERAGFPPLVAGTWTAAPSSASTVPVRIRMMGTDADLVLSLEGGRESPNDALVTDLVANPPAGTDRVAWLDAVSRDLTAALGPPRALRFAHEDGRTFSSGAFEVLLLSGTAQQAPRLVVRRRPFFRR